MILPKRSEEFLKQYWLKEDLVAICKEKGLPHTGSKEDLTRYIANYLDGNQVVKKEAEKKGTSEYSTIHKDLVIDKNYSNDENHRTFFLKEIGSRFKYNIEFMNWMKAHKGIKNYSDAIEEWLRIEKEKKKGVKKEIGKQFEYNQYTRDFFNANPDKSREDCIKCWNYRKNIPGKHVYSKDDLQALE